MGTQEPPEVADVTNLQRRAARLIEATPQSSVSGH
jgi:hypothetical protein